MHFLLDANMPRRSADAIRGVGHQCSDVRDLGMSKAPDPQIAAYAKAHLMALITRDSDFSDVRNYPPGEYGGIVVMDLPDDATASFIVTVLIAFITQKPLLEILPGRLAIVEPGRVRLRPA